MKQQQGYYEEIGKNDNSAVQWKYVCAFSLIIFSHRDSGGAVLEQNVKGEFQKYNIPLERSPQLNE